MIHRLRRRLDVVVLVALAYLPVLVAAPGRGVADTKLYLFTDPARLLAEARFAWDPQQFAGWVPHQTALYLWPSGPWFWLGDTLGVPDWLTHRLWVGTILVAAGLGVRFAGRLLGLGALAAFVAAVVYQLSPYVLPYVSRTSVMLLPWAGLGWIVGHTILAAHRGRWRHAIAAALVVLTVGATNATATLMIAPAPLLWLLWSALRHDVTWRRATSTALRIGALSLVVSSWWIVKIAVQGRYGAPVLAYSESLEAVSATSTAPEIARGLGYWLFYVSDPYIATTTAAAPHLTSIPVVIANFLVVVVGALGLVVTRWAPRGYAALLVITGTLLGVGAHLVSDPSLAQRLLFGDTRSGISLALRSSSRAVPLVSFGLVLGIGALVAAARQIEARAASRRHLGSAIAAAAIVVALVGLPALRSGGYVDPALERDDQLPGSWVEAAARLDASDGGGRVLQLPGQESAAFRWGYTVDPPLPGLSTRPLVARDWLPAGSAGVMDLMYALDDRVQTGILEPAAVAPVARWLGVDTVWLAGDVAYDRFDTARPEPVAELLADARGLGPAEAVGTPQPNVPAIPMVDEQSLGDPAVGAPIAPVSLIPVADPVPLARVSTRAVVVAGDGEGLVDAAGAGLLTGQEMVRYAADIPDADISVALADAGLVVVTDTNRVRAHHWRGSQDVVGFTEDGSGVGVLVPDPADERLDVFPRQTVDDRTIAVQRGPVQAAASRYGEALRYRPEDRAAMAIDGDETTAWVVADRGDPIGEFIELHAERGVDSVRLVQPLDADANRWITGARLVLDPDTPDATAVEVQLGASSRSSRGQTVALPRPARHLRIVIEATASRDRPQLAGLDGVGFAEIDLGLGATEEVVVPPALDVAEAPATVVVLTRLRVAATDRWRSDPEPTMVRSLPATLGDLEMADATVRLDRRATDAVIAATLGLGEVATASSRLLGQPQAGGWAALDGDPATAWVTAFGETGEIVLTIPDATPARTLTLHQRDDGQHSLVRRVRVQRGEVEAVLDLPTPDAEGRSRVALPRRLARANGELRLVVEAIEPRTTVDRRTFDVVQLPIAIVEIDGVTSESSLPESFGTECRDDVMSVDGRGIALRVSGSVTDAFAGRPLDVDVCEPVVTSGDRVLRTAKTDALMVDRVVLRRAGMTTSAGVRLVADGSIDRSEATRTTRSFTVSGCATGCWFSMGEGRNEGWTGRVDGDDLGEPVMLNGGMGGWWIPAGDDVRQVELRWSGQRVVDIAIAVSALAAASLALAFAVLRRRDRGVTVVACSPVVGHGIPSAEIRITAVIGLIATALTALVVSALAGAAVLMVLTLALVLRRAAVMSMVGLVIVAVTPLVVAWRQVRDRPLPDFGWIGHYDDLHRPFLVGLVLMATAVVASAWRGDPR